MRSWLLSARLQRVSFSRNVPINGFLNSYYHLSTNSSLAIILTATRIPPHQLKIHRIIGVASSRNLRTFGGSVVWKLAGSELGHFGVFGGSKWGPWRLLDGCLTCSGAPQACLGGSGSSRSHDPSALSVFGGHDPSKTRVLEGSEAPSSIHSSLLRLPRGSRARSGILRRT